MRSAWILLLLAASAHAAPRGYVPPQPAKVRVARYQPYGWHLPSFTGDGTWALATAEDDTTLATKSCTAPWSCNFYSAFRKLFNIPYTPSATASWYWTYDARNETSPWTSDAEFRINFSGTGAAQSIAITADNSYDLYLDGVFQGHGDNWQKVDTYTFTFPNLSRHLVAIYATNLGGPGGVFIDAPTLKDTAWDRCNDTVDGSYCTCVPDQILSYGDCINSTGCFGNTTCRDYGSSSAPGTLLGGTRTTCEGPTTGCVCTPGTKRNCTAGTCTNAQQTCAADGNSWGACDDVSACPRTGCPVERYQQSGSMGTNQTWCGDSQFANAGEMIHLNADLTGHGGVFAEIYRDSDNSAVISNAAYSSWEGSGYAYYGVADYQVPAYGQGMYHACIRTTNAPVVARITMDVAGVQTPNGTACSTHNDLCFGRQGPQCGMCGFPNAQNGMLRWCPTTVGSNEHDQCCVVHPGGYMCGGVDAFGNGVGAEYDNVGYQYCFDEFSKAWVDGSVAPFKQWSEWVDGTELRYSSDPILANQNSGDPKRWTAGLPGPGAKLAPGGARVSDANWCWGGSATYDATSGTCSPQGACTPGSTRSCNYKGCATGQQTCVATGDGWTACNDDALTCAYWDTAQFKDCPYDGQARYGARLLGVPSGDSAQLYAWHLPAPAGLIKKGYEGASFGNAFQGRGWFIKTDASCHVYSTRVVKTCTSLTTGTKHYEWLGAPPGAANQYHEDFAFDTCNWSPDASTKECIQGARLETYGAPIAWENLSGPNFFFGPAAANCGPVIAPVFNEGLWGVLQTGCVGSICVN